VSDISLLKALKLPRQAGLSSEWTVIMDRRRDRGKWEWKEKRKERCAKVRKFSEQRSHVRVKFVLFMSAMLFAVYESLEGLKVRVQSL